MIFKVSSSNMVMNRKNGKNNGHEIKSAAEKKLHTLTVNTANDIQYHIYIWNQYVSQCPVNVMKKLQKLF